LPLYLLQSRLQAVYPQVPLFANQGLGVALFSYAGSLFWGFNADWDHVPDLRDLVAAVRTSFVELQQAAGLIGAVSRRRAPLLPAPQRRPWTHGSPRERSRLRQPGEGRNGEPRIDPGSAPLQAISPSTENAR